MYLDDVVEQWEVYFSIFSGSEGQEPPNSKKNFVNFSVKAWTPLLPEQKAIGIHLARHLLAVTYPSVLHLPCKGRHLRVWVLFPQIRPLLRSFFA